jgi:hypothetical protein
VQPPRVKCRASLYSVSMHTTAGSRHLGFLQIRRQKEEETDSQTLRQTDRQAVIQSDRQAETDSTADQQSGQANRKRDRLIVRHEDRQMDSRTIILTDRQIGR